MAEASPDSVTSVSGHLSGITRLCFTPDGKTVFTGGTDCLVRIHKADDPASEPSFHDNHTEPITSLACSRSHLVTASLDNIARVFSYPQNDFEGYITRSSGVPIRWVSIDPKGERVAVCGDDLLVKIVHVQETERVTLLSDNTKSVRSATWDPQGKYLTTASCDGKIRIYDVSGSENVLLRILEGVIAPSESDSTISCYAAWHPSGLYFAVPSRTNEIAVIARDGWNKKFTFTLEGPRPATSEMAWSPNGKYLASSSGDKVLVWSRETQQVVSRYTNPEGSITGLAFSPIANLLVFTSMDGSFSRWTNPVPTSLPDPVASEAVEAKRLERLLDDDFGDGDEDMEEKGEDLEDDRDGGDDWIVDDDGAYAMEDGEKTRGGRTEVVNVTKAQEAFAPGSTSFKNKKRYLAFNMIGAIDVTDQETHNVVNVEFHDRSTRRGYHFQDHSGYTMASMGEQGIIYGAPSDGDQASSIHYRPYDSWASQSDWTMQLLPGEDAICVAAGGASGSGSDSTMGSVIVATTKGFVRFLSSSGMQRYLWRVGEDVVSMVAGREAVLIVHREGGTSLDGCQNLRYSLMSLDDFELLQEGRMPLPKRSTLSWIGFTSDGVPAMADSTGLISVLDRSKSPSQARWVPLLDSKAMAQKEGRTETYWPVGLTETTFACVVLKGVEKEPWFPRPLVQELEMHMPLLNMDNQQGKLEESVIRGEMQLSVQRESIESDGESSVKAREVALDKILLQLVQGACKADNLSRALDITRLMHNPATVDAASKVAAFYHLPGLQERIQGVKLDVEYRRATQRSKRPAAVASSSSSKKTRVGSASFGDFAPKQARRSFGGVQRDVTPAASGRAETYVPETPGIESTPAPFVPSVTDEEMRPYLEDASSPEPKRKRDEESEDFSAPKRRPEPMVNGDTSLGPKNPFAKKSAPGSNPFAKPAVARPLDAIKSTSFFERVDNIESSGVAKSKQSSCHRVKDVKAVAAGSGGKQTTLLGMKKPTSGATRPPLQAQDSLATEIGEEDSYEDNVVAVGVLEESNVRLLERPLKLKLTEMQAQETLSPDPMDD
ncbi:hypothetical protein BD324DRAFT_584077 [Kockovaella imperatae]|uniref:Uncharacterized protein n=1 Tax=Kockovaella imperatae TaxID=4999 RepID=A0A1Y1U8V6_9TREE|nr:hypothetical protein BD324DRAFT_584077 [Kockovaella imperatae]ORX33917.1 hypothetical protein BD324DRAFT_584077 [Kockovaella imperatae]